MASQITQLPTPPQRTDDQQTFTTRADALMAALQTFVTQTNTVATEAESDANTANTAASNAGTSETNAAASAAAAASSANTAINAPGTQATSTTSLSIGTGSKSLTLAQTGKAFTTGMFVTLTNSSTNWMTGNITAFTSGTGAMTVDVTSTSGTGSFASWTVVPATPVSTTPSNIVRSARTSNTILGIADKGTWIDITSGTFTQTFDAVATLQSGWWCWLGNSGTGDITLDPNSSETIDGLTSFIVYPGEVRFIQVDGSVLRSFVVTPFTKVFTTSGNFIKPPGYTSFGGLIWNGGNGGRKDTGGGAFVDGSAGGGCFPFVIPAAALTTTTAITVGAGGIGPSSTGDGGLGGASSIGTVIVMVQSATYLDGSGITNSTTAANNSSSLGFEGLTVNTTNSTVRKAVWGGGGGAYRNFANATSCVYGGAGSGAVDSAGTLRAAGVSVHGGNGGAAGDTVSGSNGVAPGGAGGPTRTGTKAGDGARGEVRIWGEV